MSRAALYVDGFNLYHALLGLNRPDLKWLSYMRLAHILAGRSASVEKVMFFSAIDRRRPAETRQRHFEYISALKATGVECILGEFKYKPTDCKSCGAHWSTPEEKESDVNLGIHLVRDSIHRAVDTAFVLTTDSDIAPAIRMAMKENPGLKVVTCHTPNRRESTEILAACGNKQKISVPMLELCLLPREVRREDGSLAATRPIQYDPPQRQATV